MTANVAALAVLSAVAGMTAYTGSVLGVILGARMREKLSGDR